ESGKSKKSFRDAMDLMMDFIANKAYNGQFTKDDLVERLHAPDAINILQEQIGFIASGEQSGGTRDFFGEKELTSEDFTPEKQKEYMDNLIRDLMKDGMKINDIMDMPLTFVMDLMEEKHKATKEKSSS